jgi:hypothetical protein
MRAWLLVAALAFGCGGARAGADGSSDTSAADAPADATGSDATAADALRGCDPAAVAFPQGGALAPGTLCDELYACADDAAGAARIEAASPHFSCAPGAEPGSGCTGYTCAYRNPAGPSMLDAAEVSDICALTVLAPPPPLRCVVFINAR